MQRVRNRFPSWMLLLAFGGLVTACGDSTGVQPADIVPAFVSAGIHHSCGLTTSGDTYCWGAAFDLTPTPLAGAPTFTTVTAGVLTSCALTPAGAAYCWGMNNNGQVGDGTTTARSEPTPVAGELTFAALATAILHSCALTQEGAAYCWGWNSNGQLGDGTTESRAVPTPVDGGLTFTAIDTYNVTTCGLATDGATYCWGWNAGGQVGDGTNQQRLVPTPVAGGVTFAQLATGGNSCALTSAGVPYCWGGEYGLTPMAIADAPALVSLSGGGGHTCGLTAAGQAYCWGDNNRGQLGDGTTTARLTAAPVAGGLDFSQLSAAGWLHTCGVTIGGEAYCWGYNQDGQLGDGTTTQRVLPTPTAPWEAQVQQAPR